MTHKFSLESEEKITEIETFLNDHAYLSGKNHPGEVDAHIHNSLKDCPDRLKHPNLFAWWWGLSLFQEVVKSQWGKVHEKKDSHDKKEGHEKKEHKEEKKECKDKKEHKEEKKESKDKKEHKEEKKDDDDLDLFGDNDEQNAKELEELKKAKEKEAEEKKKKESKKPALIAKSNVVFDVKAYEEGFDFVALSKRIREEINPPGLVWQDKFKILPVAYAIKKLQCQMIIEDDLVSADDIMEKIQELWPDDIQSCDVIEFNKA